VLAVGKGCGGNLSRGNAILTAVASTRVVYSVSDRGRRRWRRLWYRAALARLHRRRSVSDRCDLVPCLRVSGGREGSLAAVVGCVSMMRRLPYLPR